MSDIKQQDMNIEVFETRKFSKKMPFSKVKHLDITSLVDILTILLVFLIKNVSVEAQRVTVPEQMRLPTSVSMEELESDDHTIVMRVFQHAIFVGDVRLGSPDEFMRDQEIRTNVANYMRQQTEIIKDLNPDMKPIILLQSDRDMKCLYITELVSLIASSEFRGVYFSTVKGNEPDIVYNM